MPVIQKVKTVPIEAVQIDIACVDFRLVNNK